MSSVVQFTVNDTSPTISYSPFPDTFSSPNLTAGWNPYYTQSGFASAPGDLGNGTSQHITSDNGASLLLQWLGTGIQLWGNATDASYSITLDGAPFTPTGSSANLLANIQGLPQAPHAVSLTAVIPAPQNSSIVVFQKAVITSSPPPSNVTFSPQTINDDNIAFLGRWSFETAPSGASFHTSQTLGDRAVTSFNGSAFFLQGITSPDAGKYTVTIDNMTTHISGRSSFTSYNTLLFFSSGLDCTVSHSVQVTNTDGSNLSLLVGGFNTFLPSSMVPPPPPPPPTSVVTTSKSFPQGTIAAFILAGILAFLLVSGLLFFFFVYRPWRRRRRRRQPRAQSKRRSPKEHEAGVLDIGPEFFKSSSQLDFDQRESTRNGFSRWRRGAVEGSAGDVNLPIRFRHSDSLDEKHSIPLAEVSLDDVSEDSSTRQKARAKSKGKARQITGRSWSPGITLDFNRSRPHRHLSAQSAVIEGLSYVSTFIAAEPSSPRNVAPPSYAASVSLRESSSHTNPSSHPSSNMPSVPRSVSPGDHDRSYPSQNQESSGVFLLRGRESNSEPGSSVVHSLKPLEAIPMKSLAKDDNQVSLQQVFRGLPSPPHTARHPYASQDQESIPAPSSPQESDLQDNTLLPQPSNDDELVEVRDGVFLSVRAPSSPFQLNFDAMQIQQPPSDNSTGHLSYLTASSRKKSPEPLNPDATALTDSGLAQGTSDTRFRLTPLSIPPISGINPPSSGNEASEGVTSFLDFTSSREGSLASRSIKTSWSSERQRRSLYPPTFEGKSRWSNTTVPSVWGSSAHGSSDNSSQKIPLEPPPSTPPPLPVRASLLPSTYGSNRRSRVSGLTQTGEPLHVHPPGFENLESPTESIPMSVSDLRFRHSVSEGEFDSRRTTDSSLVFASPSHHPPMPIRHDGDDNDNDHDDDNDGKFIPRPFDPSILVNRVWGLPSSTSTTITARPAAAPGHSSSAPASVTATSSPSPFALRHDTTRADREQSDNLGTDLLGSSTSTSHIS